MVAMYALRPGLNFCVIEGTALFLDVPGDRYFALGVELSKRFLCVSDAIRAGESIDPVIARSLVAHGLLIEKGEFQPSAAPAPVLRPPRAEWRASAEPTRPPVRLVALALLRLFATWVRLRYRPLRSIVGDEPTEPGAISGNGTDPGQLVAAFSSALRIWPWKLECLPKSVALRGFLASHGAGADLVLAVKLNPFAAHCWVQIGDVVVGDALEHVCAFTPIRRAR